MPYLLDRRIEFKDRPLLFIDLEMTGLDVHSHEIIEIAALKVRQSDFAIENSYYTKIIPQHIETADPKSLRISGYSSSSWTEAISLEIVLKELAEFSPDSILAGWSVQNEWDFLNAALEKYKLPYFYSHHLIEVYSLAYRRFYRDPDMRFLNLPNVCRALGINVDLHKPDSDIRATYEVFKQLI